MQLHETTKVNYLIKAKLEKQNTMAPSTLLARVNFPLYSVEMLTSRHVLVAGGGGSSKTGVANGFVSLPIFFNSFVIVSLKFVIISLF